MTDILSRINTGKDAAFTGTEIRYCGTVLTRTSFPRHKQYVLEYQDNRLLLPKKPYRLFQYVYDLYRTEGRTAFEYAELSEVLTGDELKMSNNNFKYALRVLTSFISKLHAPTSLFCRKEVLYIGNQEELASHGNQAAIYAVKQAAMVREWHRISQEEYDGKGWYSIARRELEQKKRDGIFPAGFTYKDVEKLSLKIKRRVKTFRKRQNDKQLRFEFDRE